MKKILILMSFILLSAEGAMASSNTQDCGQVTVNTSTGKQTTTGYVPKSTNVYTMPVGFSTTVHYHDKSHGGHNYYQLTYCVKDITYYTGTGPTPTPSSCGTTCSLKYADCYCGSDYVCPIQGSPTKKGSKYNCAKSLTLAEKPDCTTGNTSLACTVGEPIPSNAAEMHKEMMATRKKSAVKGGIRQAGDVCIQLPTNLMSHHKGQCSTKTSPKKRYGFDLCWLDAVYEGSSKSKLHFVLKCTFRGKTFTSKNSQTISID